MKLATAILIPALFVGMQAALPQEGTNKPLASLTPLRTVSDAEWNYLTVTKSGKARCVLSITNELSQEELLSISDPVCVRNGLTRYMDALCSFGARLQRDYIGPGSVATVGFNWDGHPKKTLFSFYGANRSVAKIWQSEMLKALRDKFGEENVRIEVQPNGAADAGIPFDRNQTPVARPR